jgi:transcriptional regulator with XRE-family HTH domain
MTANDSPDPIDVEVGARIRIRRKHLSLSQSGLAEALDLNGNRKAGNRSLSKPRITRRG